MSADSQGPPDSPDSQGPRLDSWKEIAAYLNRHVTTVRRWEKHEGLPVHRHLHDKLGSVYAFERSSTNGGAAAGCTLSSSTTAKPVRSLTASMSLLPMRRRRRHKKMATSGAQQCVSIPSLTSVPAPSGICRGVFGLLAVYSSALAGSFSRESNCGNPVRQQRRLRCRGH